MIFYYFYINEQEYFEKAPIHQKNRIKCGMIRQFIFLLDSGKLFFGCFQLLFFKEIDITLIGGFLPPPSSNMEEIWLS